MRTQSELANLRPFRFDRLPFRPAADRRLSSFALPAPFHASHSLPLVTFVTAMTAITTSLARVTTMTAMTAITTSLARVTTMTAMTAITTSLARVTTMTAITTSLAHDTTSSNA